MLFAPDVTVTDPVMVSIVPSRLSDLKTAVPAMATRKSVASDFLKYPSPETAVVEPTIAEELKAVLPRRFSNPPEGKRLIFCKSIASVIFRVVTGLKVLSPPEKSKSLRDLLCLMNTFSRNFQAGYTQDQRNPQHQQET